MSICLVGWNELIATSQFKQSDWFCRTRSRSNWAFDSGRLALHAKRAFRNNHSTQVQKPYHHQSSFDFWKFRTMIGVKGSVLRHLTRQGEKPSFLGISRPKNPSTIQAWHSLDIHPAFWPISHAENGWNLYFSQAFLDVYAQSNFHLRLSSYKFILLMAICSKYWLNDQEVLIDFSVMLFPWFFLTINRVDSNPFTNRDMITFLEHD